MQARAMTYLLSNKHLGPVKVYLINSNVVTLKASCVADVALHILIYLVSLYSLATPPTKLFPNNTEKV